MRICRECGVEQSLDEFKIVSDRCKTCVYAYRKQWRRDNPTRVAEYNLRHHPVTAMTVAEFQERLQSQNGVCMICQRPERRKKRLSVDHDHVTNQKRDLLCDDCNNLLGRANDDPAILFNAIKYLKKWGK